MGDRTPVIFTLIGSFETGGIQRVALSLASSLRSRYRFSVTAYDGAGSLQPDFRRAGAGPIFLPRRPGLDGPFVTRLAREMWQRGTDLVHLHNETALFYGGLAAWLIRRPFVYTEHDRSFPGTFRRRAINRILLAAAHRVTAVSEHVAGCLRRHETGGEVLLVPNGVDPRPFDDAPTKEEARRLLGVPLDGPVLVTVGRLSPEKGIDVLAAAARRVARAVPGSRFLVAGEGPDRARLGGSPLTLLGERRDVPLLLAAADLAVIPSRSEGMPLAAIEAAAAGRPVVATRVGGVPEVVLDGRTGLLVPPEEPDRLAKAIVTLLRRADRRRVLGQEALRRFHRHFTLSLMTSGYESVFSAVLARRAA